MELATPGAFRRDPEGVWEFYRFRIAGLKDVVPNDGHRALADLESRSDRFWLITQNVDGLHQRAGSHPEKTYQIHGNVFFMRCADECRPDLLALPDHMRSVLAQKEEIAACAKTHAVTKTYWAAVGSGPNKVSADEIRIKLATPNAERIWYLADAFRYGMSLEEVHELSRVDPWFLAEIEQLYLAEIFQFTEGNELVEALDILKARPCDTVAGCAAAVTSWDIELATSSR